MNLRKFIILYIFLFPMISLFGQTPIRTVDLSKQKPSWQAVIGGEAVAPVTETSYGFAIVSDGRMVSACTSTGNVMWQKSIRGRPSPLFTSWGDFLYTITDKSTLNLLNPSGATVWSVNTGFEVTSSPVTGYDGRIFVAGNNKIACFGLKGIKKWEIKTPDLSSLPVYTLPDGSLLLIEKNPADDKTKGIRISPFGELQEEITFASQIITAAECSDGILMSFSDGSFGLCSVKENSVISKWVLKDNQGLSPVKCIISGELFSAFVCNKGQNSRVYIINNQTGMLENDFSTGILDSSQITFSRKTAQGFFISDRFKAIEFDERGTVFWEAKLPSRNNWSYIIYSKNNQLLLCMKDWGLNSYVMSQTVSSKNSVKKTERKSYIISSSLIQNIDGVIYSSVSEEDISSIASSFSEGNYGPAEKQMLSVIKEQTENYIHQLNSATVFARTKENFYGSNPVYTQKILNAVANSQTDVFDSDIAELLSLEKDPLLLTPLIACAAAIAYDKDGMILSAIENSTVSNIGRKDTKSAILICDTVYEIVRYMGRPALYKQGKSILSKFMYPQYDKSIKDYARHTMTKIAKLEI